MIERKKAMKIYIIRSSKVNFSMMKMKKINNFFPFSLLWNTLIMKAVIYYQNTTIEDIEYIF